MRIKVVKGINFQPWTALEFRAVPLPRQLRMEIGEDMVQKPGKQLLLIYTVTQCDLFAETHSKCKTSSLLSTGDTQSLLEVSFLSPQNSSEHPCSENITRFLE